MARPITRYAPPIPPRFPNFTAAHVAQGRPPGTPPGAPAPPRLPVLPAPPYSPPLAPLSAPNAPPQIQGLSDPNADFESALLPVRFNVGIMATSQEVYTTTRRWRAIDVFVSVPPSVNIGPRPAGGGSEASSALSFQLWAIDRGVRTLVATGRYGAFDQTSNFAHNSAAQSSKRVIAYRGPAEKFDVTAYANWDIIEEFAAQVALIATDEAVPVDDDSDVGVIPTFGLAGAQTGALAQGTVRIAPDNAASAIADTPGNDQSPIELVYIYAASAVAGRWVQVLGSDTTHPLASFGPLHLNSGVFRLPKGMRFQGTGFTVGISSTALTFTALGGVEDTGFVAWYR